MKVIMVMKKTGRLSSASPHKISPDGKNNILKRIEEWASDNDRSDAASYRYEIMLEEEDCHVKN